MRWCMRYVLHVYVQVYANAVYLACFLRSSVQPSKNRLGCNLLIIGVLQPNSMVCQKSLFILNRSLRRSQTGYWHAER